MCPVCLATAAVIASSATGTGGIAALIAGKILRKQTSSTQSKEVNHGNNSTGG